MLICLTPNLPPQQLPRDTVQIHELTYLFKHIPTDADKYSMFIGISAFFAMWFFNSLRKGLQPRCAFGCV